MLLANRELKLDQELINDILDKFMTDEYKFPSDELIKSSKDYSNIALGKDDRIYSSWNEMSVAHFPERVEKWYFNIIKDFMVEFGLYGRVNAVNSKWCQIYTNTTGGHNVHTHYCGQELFSWVHFVQTPKNQKCFFFVDSNSKKIYPEQSSGTFICFPPWAMHGVEPVEVDENPRIIIAGNVVAKQYKSTPFDPLTFTITEEKDKLIWTGKNQ